MQKKKKEKKRNKPGITPSRMESKLFYIHTMEDDQWHTVLADIGSQN
jgi:hypothetical protein